MLCKRKITGLEICVFWIVNVSSLAPSLPAQAQFREYEGYDNTNKICSPGEKPTCRDEQVFRNYHKPSRSKQKPFISEAPMCSTTPPYFDGSGIGKITRNVVIELQCSFLSA